MEKPNFTKIDIDELKVGDTVGYLRYTNYSWSKKFRQPKADECTITRITPKRTKIVLDDKFELTRDLAKSHLVLIDEATQYSNKIAKLYRDIKRITNNIETAKQDNIYVIEELLTDEELEEYYKALVKLQSKLDEKLANSRR